MRYIQKSNEPRSLVEYRTRIRHSLTGADFGNMPPVEKRELKNALIAEQFGLCCYCMGRITYEKMKVEHFQAQSTHGDLCLDYRNMMAACLGGEECGNPVGYHCDKSKKNKSIMISPIKQEHIERLVYTADGVITSEDIQLSSEINDVLRLNVQSLRKNRKAIYDALYDHIVKRYKGQKFPKSAIESALKKVQTPQNGILEPFCGVKEFFLLKKLKRLR